MFDPDIWNKNIWDGAAAFTTSPGDQPWTNARLHSWFLESENWGTKQHLTIYCIALLTFHQFPGNKKYEVQPSTFYCLEIGENSKVLYNIYRVSQNMRYPLFFLSIIGHPLFFLKCLLLDTPYRNYSKCQLFTYRVFSFYWSPLNLAKSQD